MFGCRFCKSFQERVIPINAHSFIVSENGCSMFLELHRRSLGSTYNQLKRWVEKTKFVTNKTWRILNSFFDFKVFLLLVQSPNFKVAPKNTSGHALCKALGSIGWPHVLWTASLCLLCHTATWHPCCAKSCGICAIS